jgi:hypothetical protein
MTAQLKEQQDPACEQGLHAANVTLAFDTLRQESETMKIKTVFRNALLAVAMACAGAGANAATTDLGTIGFGAPTPFSGSMIPAGPFIDVFTFTLPENGGSGYSVINFPLDIPGVGTFNTVFSYLALVSNPDGILNNGDEDLLDAVLSAGTGSMSLTWGPTAGGPMYLVVSGITNGTLGGIYSGAVSATAAPIPEPSTWAMLGLGVGMIGFALRRKIR